MFMHAEAVEEVIVEHYEEQIKFLEQKGVENKLLKKIKNFVQMKMITDILLKILT